MRPAADSYWTPFPASAALLADNRFRQTTASSRKLWEPAAGAGWIVKVMRHFEFEPVVADAESYGFPLDACVDFLQVARAWGPHLVTNPPFYKDLRAPLGMPLAFVEHALALGVETVWILARHNWDEGVEKSLRLEQLPWKWKLVIRQRFAMWPHGRPPAGKEKSNPPHNYAWYGFVRGWSGHYQGGYVDLRPDLVEGIVA